MRTSRKLSARTKELISQSLRRYHATRPENEKKITSEKQSLALKEYWKTVPSENSVSNTVDTTNKAIGSSAQPRKIITLEKDTY